MLDSIHTMFQRLRDLFDSELTLLTVTDPELPCPPRRTGETRCYHWLQHNPNDFVGFGVYPARVLLWHHRWPLLRRCHAEAAAGWVVFGLTPGGRERVLSLFGTHRLAESLADRYAFHWHRRRVCAKAWRR